jgi:hypothetical protein
MHNHNCRKPIHCATTGPGKIPDASEQTLLREAQQHLERARALDPEGVIAQAFIRRVRQTFLMDH